MKSQLAVITCLALKDVIVFTVSQCRTTPVEISQDVVPVVFREGTSAYYVIDSAKLGQTNALYWCKKKYGEDATLPVPNSEHEYKVNMCHLNSSLQKEGCFYKRSFVQSERQCKSNN